MVVKSPTITRRLRLSERLQATKKKEDKSSIASSVVVKQNESFQRLSADEGSRYSTSSDHKTVTAQDRQSFLAERRLQNRSTLNIIEKGHSEQVQKTGVGKISQVQKHEGEDSNQESKTNLKFHKKLDKEVSGLKNYPIMNNSTRRRQIFKKAMRKTSGHTKSNVAGTMDKGTSNLSEHTHTPKEKKHASKRSNNGSHTDCEQFTRDEGKKSSRIYDARDDTKAGSSERERRSTGSSYNSRIDISHEDHFEKKQPDHVSSSGTKSLRWHESFKATENIDSILDVHARVSANMKPSIYGAENDLNDLSQSYQTNARERAKEIIVRRKNKQMLRQNKNVYDMTKSSHSSYSKGANQVSIINTKQSANSGTTSPVQISTPDQQKFTNHMDQMHSTTPWTQPFLHNSGHETMQFSESLPLNPYVNQSGAYSTQQVNNIHFKMNDTNNGLAKLDIDSEHTTKKLLNKKIEGNDQVLPNESKQMNDETEQNTKSLGSKLKIENNKAEKLQNASQSHGVSLSEHVAADSRPADQMQYYAFPPYRQMQTLQGNHLSSKMDQTNQGSYMMQGGSILNAPKSEIRSNNPPKTEYYGMFHPTKTQQSAAASYQQPQPNTFKPKKNLTDFQKHTYPESILKTPGKHQLNGYQYGRNYQEQARVQPPSMPVNLNQAVTQQSLHNSFPTVGSRFFHQLNAAQQMRSRSPQTSRGMLLYPHKANNPMQQQQLNQLKLNSRRNLAMTTVPNEFSSSINSSSSKQNGRRLYASATDSKTKDSLDSRTKDSSYYDSHSGSTSYYSSSGSTDSYISRSQSFQSRNARSRSRYL